MDRTIALNHGTALGKRTFVNEDLVGGIQGTEMDRADAQAWQEELVGVIEGAGVAPDASDLAQVFKGIRRLAGANTNFGAAITASGSLTADNAGLVIVDATAGNIALTLPLSNAAGGKPFNFRIVRSDVTTHTVTLSFAGSDTLLFGAGPMSLVSQQVLHVGASGGTTWVNFFEGALPLLSITAGWERRSSGLIEQWGRGTTVTGADAVTFPIPFPTAIAGINVSERNASAGWSSGGTIYGADSPTITGFNVYAKNVASGGALTAGTGIAYFYRALGW